MRAQDLFRLMGLTLLCMALQARGEEAPKEEPKAQTPVFMWKLMSKDVTLYVLGSIHVAKADFYPLDPRIEKAFEASDKLLVECDLTHIMEKADIEFKKWWLPEGDELDKHLSDATRTQLNQFIEENKLLKDEFVNCKPWAAISLIQHELISKLGYKAKNGIDLHFLKQASGKKNIVEIDDTKPLWDALDALPAEKQEQLLIAMLKRAPKLAELMNEQLKLWCKGDLKGLEQHTLKNFYEGWGEIQKVDLDDRNAKMVENIQTVMKQPGTYFIVVGSAHLWGEKGLLELLKKQGLSVEQQ